MKNIVAMALSFVILFNPFNLLSVHAEENKIAEIEVSSENVEEGSTVGIEVSIKNNPGILGATFELSYDSGLTLKAVNTGDAFTALTLTKPGVFESGCKFVWDGIDIDNTDIKDGTILTLTFDVDDSAKTGDVYNVKVTCKDAIDNNLNPVSIDESNGKINIVNTETNKSLEKIVARKSKTIYNVNDILNIDDVDVTAYYTDLTKKTISKYNTNISEIDMSVSGEKKLIISYTDKEITKTSEIKISVKDAGLYNNPKIAVDSNVVLPGDQIDINILLNENPGVLGMALKLQFDSKLSLVSAKSGEAFDVLTMTKPGDFSSGCKFIWDGTDLGDEDVKNGTILTLTFLVAEDAKVNEKLIVSAVCEDAVDRNLQPVKVTVQSGAITVGDKDTVVKNELNAIEVSKDKVTYETNEKLNIDDLIVTASYNGGVTKPITDYVTNVSEIDMSVEGIKKLIITYTEEGITKSFELLITVKASEKQEQLSTEEISEGTGEQQSQTQQPTIEETSEEEGGQQQFEQPSTEETSKGMGEQQPQVKQPSMENTSTGSVNNEQSSADGGKGIEVEGVGIISNDGKIFTDTDGDVYYIADKVALDQLKVGNAIADETSSGKYIIMKVTQKNGKITGGTVAYMKPYNTNDKNITIKDTVKLGGVKFKITNVANNALKKCEKLNKVTIGKNVTKIGNNAFNGCSKLSKITIKSKKLKSVGKNAIKGINKNAVIKVPRKQLKNYKKLFKSKTGYKKSMKIKK